MRKSQVLQKLRAGKPAIFFCFHNIDPSFWEMWSLMGIDCLWFDMEHHAHNMETANQLFRATRVGTSDVICRIGKGEWMRMGRALEAGATGILYPRIDDAAEAREVVRWARFAPLGERGCDGGNPDMPYCAMDYADYVKTANEETFVIVQCESKSTLPHLDEIFAVDGVDGVMLGPCDFSVLSGFPGEIDHPDVWAALEQIAAAAERAGKYWGTTCGPMDNDRTRRLLDMGARLLFSGGDLGIMKTALEEYAANWKQFGIEFNNQLAAGKSYLDK